jgi:molecular chaperone GrpE
MTKEKHTPEKDVQSQTLNKESIEGLQKELEEKKNQYIRLLADFDNYKKRVTAEQEQLTRFAAEQTLLEVLPIMDNFERAFRESQKKTGTTDELIEGIALIKKQFEDALKKIGVQKIETLDKPFDPYYHEVVMEKEAPGKTKGIIIEDLQTGYLLFDKVIRHSMVVVAK